MSDASPFIESLVLTVHHRNGGAMTRLDFGLRLLDPKLALDSLDLAEIMVAIEKQLGGSPFEAPTPPRTWGDVVHFFATSEAKNLESRRQL
jgi:hypothetical protein